MSAPVAAAAAASSSLTLQQKQALIRARARASVPSSKGAAVYIVGILCLGIVGFFVWKEWKGSSSSSTGGEGGTDSFTGNKKVTGKIVFCTSGQQYAAATNNCNNCSFSEEPSKLVGDKMWSINEICDSFHTLKGQKWCMFRYRSLFYGNNKETWPQNVSSIEVPEGLKMEVWMTGSYQDKKPPQVQADKVITASAETIETVENTKKTKGPTRSCEAKDPSPHWKFLVWEPPWGNPGTHAYLVRFSVLSGYEL